VDELTGRAGTRIVASSATTSDMMDKHIIIKYSGFFGFHSKGTERQLLANHFLLPAWTKILGLPSLLLRDTSSPSARF
jgi:hypothetical protein